MFSHIICLIHFVTKNIHNHKKTCPRRDSNPRPLSLARKPKQRCDSNAVRFFAQKLLTDLADFQYQTLEDLIAHCL